MPPGFPERGAQGKAAAGEEVRDDDQGRYDDAEVPQYAAEKFITCKIIRNTESRFCNRKRKDGWLTPSARHLVQTHVNLVHKIQKYLPVTDVALEVNRFAFML